MERVAKAVATRGHATHVPEQRAHRFSADNVARAALVPTILLCLIGYYGSIAWTVGMSFTTSGVLPNSDWAGLAQYERLWSEPRWHTSFGNMFIFGGFYIGGCLAFGTLLAIAVDQGVRGRTFLQTVFLYPIALSFIVTGLIWQWFLNPTTGLQDFVRTLGWESFTFDWLSDPDRAVYTLVLAGVWHSSGLVMAIIYAGLGSIDNEIWRAGRVDGVPGWRMYIWVILPMLAPVLLVCVVLLAMNVVKSYELVIAMTGGGPGYATDLPAKFVVDNLFTRANIGLASAAAVVMLLTILAILVLSGLARRWRA